MNERERRKTGRMKAALVQLSGPILLMAIGLGLYFAIASQAKAQTPEAKRAAVLVDCGSCRGSGCLVDTDGCGNYLVWTAAHVVNGERSVCVEIDGKKYPASVLATTPKPTVGCDAALLEVAADVDVPIVPMANPPVKVGAAVWSAGYPGILPNRKQMVRRGTLADATDRCLQIDYQVAKGESGAPLFTAEGVVGVIGHACSGVSYATEARERGWPSADPAAEEMRLLGRSGGGGCAPDGSGLCRPRKPDPQPTPAEEIPTPAIVGSAQRLVEIHETTDQTRQIVAAMLSEQRTDHNIAQAATAEIKAILTEPEETPAGVNWPLLGGLMAVCGGAAAAYRFKTLN